MEDDLIIRFIERKCTLEEARQILRWIEEDEEHKAYFRQLQSVSASIDIDYAVRTDKVMPEEVRTIMNKVRRKRIRLMACISVAISVAAVILLFVFSPFSRHKTYDYEKALARVVDRNEIVLTVHNDKRIELSDSTVVVSYNKKGEILINDTITLSEEKEVKSDLNTIHVPYGKRSTLILADGTKVHINSGSSLVYPADFARDKREVYLDGEAYFEVAKEKERHFVVQTASKAVEVLGTKFNVSIDKESNLFETVLVSGKIALDSNDGRIELAPDQYYGYDANLKQEELKTVDVRNYISWIDGKLKFSRAPLSNVIRKIEKSYNIKIEILDSKYLDYKISGNLDLKSTPEETMNVLMRILIPNYKSQKQKLYLIKSEK